MTEIALSSCIGRPKVYITGFVQDDTPWRAGLYYNLLDLLKERAEVIFVKSIGELKFHVEGPHTRSLLFDEDSADPENQEYMLMFAQAVREWGSQVVLGGVLPIMATWDEIDTLLRVLFKLPWKHATYTKDNLELCDNLHCSTQGLLASQYIKALFLKGLPELHRLYQAQRRAEALAACAHLGSGFIGYVGAPACEPLGNRAVLALLGLPPVDDEQSFRLATRATKLNEGLKREAFIDTWHADF